MSICIVGPLHCQRIMSIVSLEYFLDLVRQYFCLVEGVLPLDMTKFPNCLLPSDLMVDFLHQHKLQQEVYHQVRRQELPGCVSFFHKEGQPVGTQDFAVECCAVLLWLCESGWNPKLRGVLCMRYEKLYIEQSFAISVNISF